MKQYKAIDLAKFVCAILIIILHTAPFASYSKVLTVGFRNIITIIAVPFFFVASGFIAFKKIDGKSGKEQTNYVLKHLKRIVIMYLIWSAIYFVFVAIKWARAEDFSIYYVLEYIKDFFLKEVIKPFGFYLPCLWQLYLFGCCTKNFRIKLFLLSLV
ncbi:MAG: acyltransferase family protein [Clostridia bacterium]|nr:acyltransferase family protein [Clostridia bacterium]